jgi:gas vesicle protein
MSAFWYTVAGIVFGGIISAVISYIFARQSSRELRREAERLRQLTVKLIRILEASGQIEVSSWDPKTGEPSSYPVGKKAQILYNVEAPTPRWKRLWRRVFGR